MRRAVKTRKRMGALFMSVALAMAQLPMVTMAKGSPPEDGSIASFAVLERSAARQTVEARTAYEDLILPDTVMASVYHVTEEEFIPDEDADGETNNRGSLASPSDAAEKASDSNAGHSSGKDNREPDVIITLSEEEIPVEWEANPAYDGDIPGKYVFTAEVTGYVMSDRATAPQITVTVLPKLPVNNTLVRLITDWTFVATDYSDYAAGELVLGGVSAENQMDFDAVAGMLPKQISVEIQGESNSVTLDIPQWLCPEYRQDSEENWPVSGSYTFTAVLQEGYDLAEGAARPEITVLVGGANVLSGEIDGLTIVANSGSGSAKKDGNGNIVLNDGSFTINGTWTNPNTGIPSEAVIIAAGTCNITLDGVMIVVDESKGCGAFVIEDDAEVTLTLSGDNVLKSDGVHAGLEVGENSTLTINGSGTLDATGGEGEIGGAGIGGKSGSSAGTIIIKSGTIIATGTNFAAGIGGGGRGESGSITINGGTVRATGARGGAGIGGGEGGKGDVTINGGTIIAKSVSGAGVGGGYNESGNVEITGGRVTAVSTSGAGIGPGMLDPNTPGSAAGTVIISGGMVTADSTDQSAAGIGGDKVDFSTGNEGNAVIIANSIECKDKDTSRNDWRGLIIEENSGKLYSEEVVLTQDLEIGDGVTITVEAGKTLTVDKNVTLTNKGTIIIDEGGILNNFGTIIGGENISGNYNHKKSEVQLRASNENPVYGDTITLTASITEKIPAPANSRVRLSTPVKTVLFYRGNDEIGRVPVVVDTSTGAIEGSLEVTLEEPVWTTSTHTLIAKYTGSNDQLLSSESEPLMLTVKKRSQNTPSAPTANGEPSDTTVILNTTSGQKYACTDSEIKPAIGGDIWKEATGETLLFSDLNSNTNYYFWTYIPGDTYCNDSPVSDFARITTDKNSDQKAIDAAKAAIEVGSYTVPQTDAETEEALKAALSKQINDLGDVKNNDITVKSSDIMISAFKEATAGDADESAGTNGSFTFTVAFAKGKESGTTAGKTGMITATPFTGKTNAEAIGEAKAAIEGGSYTVSQSDAETEEALKTALSDQINVLDNVKNNDITVKPSDITLSSFTAATAGDADEPAGTDGSFTFTVALSKGKMTSVTAGKIGAITATPFTGKTNAKAVAEAKAAIEGGSYTVSQADAGTEETLKTALSDQINVLDNVKNNDITVQSSDITLSSFTAATAGDADEPAGTDGSFTFTVVLAKGKETSTTAGKTGTITATPFTGKTNAKAVAEAKAAIESVSYTVFQSDAETEETLKTALSDQINELDDVKNNDITVEPSDITISAFKEATAGDADEPAGTDGSFTFTVALSKGKMTSATAGKIGAITATPFTGKTNAKAVAEAKAAIEGGSYTVSEADAGTEETLKTALSKQINDLGDVKNNKIIVKSSDIMISAFKEATAGDADEPAGTDGSFTFTVVLAKGKKTGTTADKTGTITATPFIGKTNEEAVSEAKAAIEGGSYTVSQSDAEKDLKTALSAQINALANMKNTGITVESSDITINPVTAATAGDADEPAGANGSFTFTVSLAKGAKTGTTADKTGTITATPFTGKTNEEAVSEAKAAIEGSSYTVSQNEAEKDLKTALSKQISALDNVKDNITVDPSDITLSSITDATAGDADEPTGTNGSFTFTVTLTKGKKTSTTADKTGTITATPFTGKTNEEAVSEAKAAIEGGTYTVAQNEADTEKDLKTALSVQINALANMKNIGITVKSSDITLSSFTAATAGGADEPAGTNGSFTFTVALAKGDTGRATASASGTITATPFIGKTNTEAVAEAKAAIEGGSYAAAQTDAETMETLKAFLNQQINALDGVKNNGITVKSSDITVNPFNPATAGTAGSPDGTSGSFTFTVALSKGSATAVTASKTGTITATPYVSSDATLSSLSVEGAAISPVFNPAIDSYTASVGYGVSNITVTATAADGRVKVSGDIGTKSLKVGSNTFTITVTAEDGSKRTYTVTITRAAYSGGGGSSGNRDHSSSSDSGNSVTIQTSTGPEIPTTGITPPVMQDKDGSVTFRDDTISAAISAAKQNARSRGSMKNGIAVTVPANTVIGQTVFRAVISTSVLDKLIAEQVARFDITTNDMISFSFTLDTLKQLRTYAEGGQIIFVAKKESGLTGSVLDAIGSRPAYDIGIFYPKDGNEVPITTLNGNTVTVKLSYIPAEGEDTGHLYAVYVDDAKTVHWLETSIYDPSQKVMIFEAAYFNIYGVGSRPAPDYMDTLNH